MFITPSLLVLCISAFHYWYTSIRTSLVPIFIFLQSGISSSVTTGHFCKVWMQSSSLKCSCSCVMNHCLPTYKSKLCIWSHCYTFSLSWPPPDAPSCLPVLIWVSNCLIASLTSCPVLSGPSKGTLIKRITCQIDFGPGCQVTVYLIVHCESDHNPNMSVK